MAKTIIKDSTFSLKFQTNPFFFHFFMPFPFEFQKYFLSLPTDIFHNYKLNLINKTENDKTKRY